MPLQITYDDNHIRFLDERRDVSRCPDCNVATHPFDQGFPAKDVPRDQDLSNCFEGFALASPRFKDFLETRCTSPIAFFETGGGYFILRPAWSVFEDFSATRIEHGDFCDSCGRYNSSHGVPIGILAGQRAIGPFDLVRSANELGPKGQKSFSLIAGDGLAAAMQTEGFAGIGYLDYRDDFVAQAALTKAAALHKNREYTRSVQMYQGFINDFSIGIPGEADRAYLVAYAAYHRNKVGRKIGQKHFPETTEDDLKSLEKFASAVYRARFPVTVRVD